LKAVFNYYNSFVKLTSEGDAHLTDEALSGLGTTFQFLKVALFGAILQIANPPPTRFDTPASDIITIQPTTSDLVPDHLMPSQSNAAIPDRDPYVPLKPARRKAQAQASLADHSHDPAEKTKLTDLVPDLGYFVAGGLSGIASRTATAPLDRLKVYLIAQTDVANEAVSAAKHGQPLQATKHGMRSLWHACKDLWAAGGMRSLFAGKSSLRSSHPCMVFPDSDTD
jgi:solute carrier family 25 (mitochondrial phosphate transporter), member 23/24/25/41